jgi:hypothetical protein
MINIMFFKVDPAANAAGTTDSFANRVKTGAEAEIGEITVDITHRPTTRV